jgi:hypothetical protein
MALLDIFRFLVLADHFAKQDQEKQDEKTAIMQVKYEMLMIQYLYGIIGFEEWRDRAIEVQIEGGHSKRNARKHFDEYIEATKRYSGVNWSKMILSTEEDYQRANLDYLFQTRKIARDEYMQERIKMYQADGLPYDLAARFTLGTLEKKEHIWHHKAFIPIPPPLPKR